MWNIIVGLSLTICLFCAVAEAQPVKIEKREPIRVKIEKAQPETVKVQSRIISPLEGEAVGKLARVRGVVRQPSEPVWISVGGIRQPVRVHPDGSFEEVVVFSAGTHALILGAGSDTLDIIQVRSDIPSTSLRVQLSWDMDRADLDLYIRQPNGETVWFHHQNSDLGFLDVDDTDGFGPEAYRLITPVSGVFQIYVHYFATHGCPSPVPYRLSIIKDDRLVHQYEGELAVASSWIAGPDNAGHGASWRHITNVTLP